MTPPPRKHWNPAQGAFFDKMCHTQCVTCRFIHNNFCNLCIQRQTCYFRDLLIMLSHSKKKKKGRGNNEPCCLSWLGCWMGSHASPPLASFSSSNAHLGTTQPAHGPPHLPSLALSSKGHCERQGEQEN